MKRVCFTFLFLSFPFLTSGQVVDNEPAVSYDTPREYMIGGIEISGTKYLDSDILISLSGLRQGQVLQVPGEEITKAVKALWKQGLFTNVKIYQDKIIGDKVFLNIHLQERPRLARYRFRGIKKSEHDDIRDKIHLTKGRVLTENIKLNVVTKIKNYYWEKGFLNAKVKLIETSDSLMANSILLTIDIRKGKKIKIENIDIEGVETFSEKKAKKKLKNTNEKVYVDWPMVLRPRKDSTSKFGFSRLVDNLSVEKLFHHINKNANLNIFKSSKFLADDYEADKHALIAAYNTKGYRDARITWDTIYQANSALQIEIEVYEGNKYYFRNITWKGNAKHSDEKLSRILGIEKGDVYDQSLLEQRLFMSQNESDVSSLYMNDGHLFFQVTPVEVLVEADSIDLEIRIHEGREAVINEVRIVGNTKTNEHVIRRELRTLPGSKFSRSDLIRSQREIANLGYFDPESIGVNPYPNPENGTVDIEYTVSEKPSDQLELSAGWGGKGRGVIGTLGLTFTNFSLKNIFNKHAWSPLPSGDGQRLSIRAQTNGKLYQSYNLSFTEPWLGGKRANSFTMSAVKSKFADLDSERKVVGSFVTNGGTIALGTRLKWPDDYFTFQTAINIQNYNLTNWRANNFLFSDGNSNNISLQGTLSRTSIDAPIYPRRGSNISLSLKVTPPYSLFNPDKFTDPNLDPAEKYKWVEYHKWRFNADWYISLIGNLVLKTSVKLGFLGFYNKDIGVSPFERFELGGDGLANFTFYGRDIISLRGYDVLTPSDAAAIFDKFTMELRYPFSTNPSSTIYALAFVEGGNFWQSFNQYNPFDINRSAGLGVRIFLPMFGLLGFDYGIGFDKTVVDEANGFGDYLGKYGKFSIILGFEPE